MLKCNGWLDRQRDATQTQSDDNLTVVIFPLGRIQSLGSPPVFGIVVDEHVVRHGQQLALHAGDGRDHHLI